MKKILTLIIAAVMSLGMVACGGGRGDGNYAKDDTYTADGKLKIQYFGVDLDSLQARTTATQKVIDVIENKFQVSFEILNGSATSWKQQLSQYIGGGDVPDIFFHTKDEPNYSTWLGEQYLFNYSEMLDSYPNVKAAFGRFPQDLKVLLGGDYYSYPVVMDSTTDRSIINEHALYYRRDWYENLVAKNFVPSSGRALVDPESEGFDYNNFYDLAEGFTAGDPDNDSSTDTYGYSLTKDGGIYWWYPLLSMWGAMSDGWVKDDSGKWAPEAISDNMKNAVMWIADMYDNGLINSNYATTATQAVMKNDFANGVAGMMTYNATFPMGKGILDLMETYAVNGKTLSDVVRAMPVVTGADGTKKMMGYANHYGFLAINQDVSDNKKAKILSIMDWMLSDEGTMLLNYGIEGEHYQVENNEIVSLLGNDQYGFPRGFYDDAVAPGVYRIKGLVSWSTIVPKTIKHYSEQLQLLNAWKSEYLFADELQYISVDTGYALKIASLNDMVSSAYKDIVKRTTGDKASKRNEIWNTFVSNYTRSGDAYINEVNIQAKNLSGIE